MDLEERFKIPAAEVVQKGKAAQTTYTLVIEAETYTIGLLVKDVPQSLSVPVSKIDKTPGIIRAINVSEDFIDGIAKDEGRLIVVLDMQKVLNMEEIMQLPA